MWGALSDGRTGVSFTIASGPHQQSLSDPSPVGIVTIFYGLRFENSLFVASYDSQGYGGGIRPRLHTEVISLQFRSQSQSHIATDGQSIGKSWCRVPSGAHDQIFTTFWQLPSCFSGAPFVYAAGPRQRSLSRMRVPWDSCPYFTASDFRLPFSSPPTTHSVTVLLLIAISS
jgi:hypothetical protein